MTITLALVRRNLELYFREIGSVALSLLSVVILLGLYVLFLGQLQIKQLTTQLPQASGNDIQFFVASWVFAGLILIATFTTGIGALGSFVDDRSTGRFAEFRVSPIRRYQLILGYQLAAFIVAVIMSTAILIIGVIVLATLYRKTPDPQDLLAGEGYVLLLSFTFSALSSLIMTFVRSRAGFTGVSVTVGTVLGFVAGAYLPIGTLATGIDTALEILPFSPAAMLLRTPLAGDALTRLGGSGEGTDTRATISDFYGFTIHIGDLALTPLLVSIALTVLAIVFTALGALRIGHSIETPL